MKISNSLFVLCLGLLAHIALFGQETTIWSEDFEGDVSSWTLNSGGSGDNQWIINNEWGNAMICSIFPLLCTPSQSSTVISPPDSYYLHIYDGAQSYTLNALFNAATPSNNDVVSPSISTAGYAGVKLSYWWLGKGLAGAAEGKTYYSIDNGSTWTLLRVHHSQGTWQLFDTTLAVFDNQSQIKLKFNWINGNNASIAEDPAFSVDDIRVYIVTPLNGITNGTLNGHDLVCHTYQLNTPISYTATGTFNAGNQYIIELSDANGSFSSPTLLATETDGTAGAKTTSIIVPNTLPPGTGYKIRIRSTDLADTSALIPFTVQPLPTLTFTSPSCISQSASPINLLDYSTATPPGGTSVYTGTGVSENLFNPASAGAGSHVLTFQYMDTNMCPNTINTTIVVSDFDLTAINTVNSTCGQADGSIELVVSGGTAPYQYNIKEISEANYSTVSASTSSHIFNNLTSGTYVIYVADNDGAGCVLDTVHVTLAAPGEPTVQNVVVTNISCHGLTDGKIAVSATGVGTISYTLKDSGMIVLSTNTTGLFESLSAGNYYIEIVDANNCPHITQRIITEPDPLSLTLTHTDANCGQNIGSIAWEIAGGTGTLSVSVNGQPQTISPLTELPMGTYSVLLTDDNGCTKTGDVTISSTGGTPPDSALITVVHSGCYGPCSGSITANSPNATVYTLDTLSNTSGVFGNLCYGNYTLTVSNGSGCDIVQTIDVLSVESPKADFLFSPSNPTTFNSQVTFYNYSTYANTYQWTISDVQTGSIFMTNQESFTHSFSSPDSNIYTVCLVASNNFGCSDKVCKDITIQDDIMLFIPNSFSPDDNEYNQTWKITVIGVDDAQFELLVYNRWGQIVYESHDHRIGWDAMYDNQPIPEGMYSWKITVKDPVHDFRKVYSGHVNVIR